MTQAACCSSRLQSIAAVRGFGAQGDDHIGLALTDTCLCRWQALAPKLQQQAEAHWLHLCSPMFEGSARVDLQGSMALSKADTSTLGLPSCPMQCLTACPRAACSRWPSPWRWPVSGQGLREAAVHVLFS